MKIPTTLKIGYLSFAVQMLAVLCAKMNKNDELAGWCSETAVESFKGLVALHLSHLMRPLARYVGYQSDSFNTTLTIANKFCAVGMLMMNAGSYLTLLTYTKPSVALLNP